MTHLNESFSHSPEILTTLRKQQQDYYFEPFDANAHINNKTVIGLMGPTGIGKTTLSNEVVRIDTDVAAINTMTTRARRTDDPEGFMTANEGVTHQTMYDDIARRRLVHYSVHDDGHVYGTSPDGFAGAYSIGPMSSDSVDNLLSVGFRDFFPVFMATDADTYQQRLEQASQRYPDISKRLNDSLAIISFGRLNHDAPWLSFIDSGSDPTSLNNAAADVVRIANQRTLPIMGFDRRLDLLDQMEHTIERAQRQLG